MSLQARSSEVQPLSGCLPLEIRVHGRGGQGGVTCAKLIASVYSELGLHVQTFGDYGMERAGAPVRAFTRVDTAPITNRNKVYRPNHVLVLDPALMDDDALEGAAPAALLLLNTSQGIDAFAGRYATLRFATVDATAIARRHGIGTSAVVIVNTTMAGAYARVLGLRWEVVEKAYASLGLEGDLGAAKEAYQSVSLCEPGAKGDGQADRQAAGSSAAARVLDLTEHTRDIPTPLKTGSWRTQMPKYRAHVAPCNASCPAGNDVVGFVQALKTQGVEAAARVLLRTQPLPSICGRVCPAPCMSACNRGTYDGAVNIRALERWIGDHAAPRPEPLRQASPPRRIAIVGSGPAGLGAAFALSRSGHDVTIFEGEPKLGGVLRTGIPWYRLPEDVLDRDLDRILSLGVNTSCGAFLDSAAIGRLAESHDAVIVATGLPSLGELACPGADLEGIGQGIRFLHSVKGGGGAVQGHVVVVGGGNTAIDCARSALRRGASKVTLAYRRSRNEMPAIRGEVEDALREGVGFLLQRQPVRFVGSRKVTGVELAEVELGEPDGSGRRRPVVTDRTSVIACDGVLLAIGQSPDLGVFPEGWTIRDGRALSGAVPRRVWLAGDVATGEGTVSQAVGHGRRVADRVLAALGAGGDSETSAPAPEELVTPAHVRFSHFAVELPHADRHIPVPDRLGGFREVDLGLPGPEEAGRCFSCGCCTRCDTCLLFCPEGIIRRQGDGYWIDGEYCKGCGMCVAECPRRAMEMTTEGMRR